jgi:heme exporter protein CcmD
MMDQAAFVWLSYAVSALVIGALSLWIYLSAARAQAKVDKLEKLK